MSTAPVSSSVESARACGGWRVRLRRVGATGLAWCVLAGLVEAGSAKDDLYQTVLARRALQNDALLAPLNLGVRVRDRVATLWGPVSSVEAARRAVALLRELPELATVRSELFLDPWADHALDRPRVPLPSLPGRPADGPELPAPPPQVVQRPADPRSPEQPPTGVWTPGHPLVSGGAAPGAVAATPAVRLPSRSPSLPTSSRTPVAVVPPPTPPLPLEELIGRLQRGEERFRRLRVEVESGQVFLSGAVPSWPDLHAFARAVAELPGVSNVTLRSIRVDPPRR